MSQTRLHSALESAANVAIGGYFTGISIARSYLVRRWFNRRTA